MNAAAGRRQLAAAADQVRLVQLLTTEEAASAFRVDPYTVRRWRRLGFLAGIRTPGQGRWRFRAEDVAALLKDPPEPSPNAGQFQSKSPAAASAPEPCADASPRITAAAGPGPRTGRGGRAAGTQRANRDARIPGRPHHLVAVPQPPAGGGDDIRRFGPVAGDDVAAAAAAVGYGAATTGVDAERALIEANRLRYGETL